MKMDQSLESHRLWLAIVWSLRLTIAVQCLGNWQWFSQIGESPLLSWMIDPQDIGGLAWSEATGLAVQQTVGWLALVAGVCVVLRPCAAVLGPLCLLQLLLAVAMWQTDSGFVPQTSWLLPQQAALFPLATQSARIAAPLALLLLDPWRVERPLKPGRVRLAVGLLLVGAAIAFLSHGIESLQLNPRFLDLLISTSSRLFGAALPQSSAEILLSVIGVFDVFVAIACLTARLRGVLWWMAFWGMITAISRITAFGWESSWYAAATRAPHLGAPLAVVLYWHLLRWRTARGLNQEK